MVMSLFLSLRYGNLKNRTLWCVSGGKFKFTLHIIAVPKFYVLWNRQSNTGSLTLTFLHFLLKRPSGVFFLSNIIFIFVVYMGIYYKDETCY